MASDGEEVEQLLIPSAEYLVSQSTNTCLTVISGSGPQDAVLGLAKFTGSPKQQWYIQGGRWEWGGDRSLCLAPNAGHSKLCLIPKGSRSYHWGLDSAERLTFNDHTVLDVPWEKPRREVILYAKHSGTNQKWWLLSDLRTLATTDLSPAASAKLAHICRNKCPQKGEPDYLINQSSQTVLSVLSGSGTSDAVVGMAPYDGGVRQQWHYKNQQLLWGQDQNLCLVPDWSSSSLTLAPCDANPAVLTMDHQGVVSCGRMVLDVPWEDPRHRVIVYPKHGGINQRWWNLKTLTSATQSHALQKGNDNTCMYKKEVARDLVNRLCHPHDPLPCQRNVSQFPGCVSPRASLIIDTVTLDLSSLGQRPNLRMTVPEDWQATDLYVRDGVAFQVVLPDSLSHQEASQITVRVGAHCDHLEPASDNLRSTTFKRMPIITEEFDVTPGVNNLRSQYGGNLIFTFEEGCNFKVNVEVRNVVKCAHYILNKTHDEEWNSWKKTRICDAPYSILETDNVVLVVPSASAKALKHPGQLLQRYDRVIQLLNDLSGFDESDPPPRGKQWLVEDVQITAGSAHAGFPAMFCQDYYELCCLDTPHDWVTWHELGHNFQQGKWWSYAYGSESTVNLFSLYIQETVKGEDRLVKEKRYRKTASAVDKGLTFEEADCWEKLVFLMEMKHAFPQVGWEMYRAMNRTIRSLSDEEARYLASSQQAQYDLLYEELSRSVGVNLLPHYQRWGLDVSHKAQHTVSQMGLPMAPADLAVRN